MVKEIKVYRNHKTAMVNSRELFQALKISDESYNDWIENALISRFKRETDYLENGDNEFCITLNAAERISLRSKSEIGSELAVFFRSQIRENKDSNIQKQEFSVLDIKTFPLSILADILAENGLMIGERRLFELLRNNDFLLEMPKNFPSQKSFDMGLMEIRKYKTNPYQTQSRLTQHGLQFFANYFLQRGGNT